MNNMMTKTSPFGLYAAAASPRALDGKLLKFSKGDWLVGADGDVLNAGSKLIALMNTLTIGWQKWQDGRPVEARTGLVVDGHRPPQRAELGDDDPRTWEVDANGETRDPWQFDSPPA
jgi:hypothetical protein